MAEELLAAQGFTLGHFPQSFEYATIGGFAATRSSGQYSVRYGRFDELVVALRVATARGTVDLGRVVKDGLCIAIEPMVNVGGVATRVLDDHWTVVTEDGSLSAHFEHTLACFPEGPVILTRAEGAENGADRQKIGAVA